MSTVVDHRIVPSPSSPPPSPDKQGTFDSERQKVVKEIVQQAMAATRPRHNWTRDEIAALYYQPLMELTFQAVS
jgi:biotin synthase